MMIPKLRRFQSESYRRFVGQQPCFSCGIVGYSQCAHANGGGMGTKASDLDTFPLCASRPGHMGCHMQFDLCIDMTKNQRRIMTAEYIERMQAISRADGRPEFAEKS